jgi:hypothetical protein
VGTAGFFYKVSVAGGTVLDGNADWHVGDLLIFDGTSWDKIDNYEAVTSVAGRTGAVVLTKQTLVSATSPMTLSSKRPIWTPTERWQRTATRRSPVRRQ